jgi:23S rRNA (cytidine1920-2'-O)/16S rRNA (cytidine1409-2'-O)-methyltransferase
MLYPAHDECLRNLDGRLNKKARLDHTMVAKGLAPSRARAHDLIQRGFVTVDGQRCLKASTAVTPAQQIVLDNNAPDYVSRGAEKLIAALDAFDFHVRGRIALDVGASTGGFTQVLIERGASLVYAVDVGHGQLHQILSSHPHVVALESTDARNLDTTIVRDRIEAIVADLSFISVTKALPAALALAAPGAWLVTLIKPQFEAGREHVGRGGIVRDPEARQQAVRSVETWIEERSGWTVTGVVPSPILGGSGNAEFLIGATFSG